jgi:hypothetical protein
VEHFDTGCFPFETEETRTSVWQSAAVSEGLTVRKLRSAQHMVNETSLAGDDTPGELGGGTHD